MEPPPVEPPLVELPVVEPPVVELPVVELPLVLEVELLSEAVRVAVRVVTPALSVSVSPLPKLVAAGSEPDAHPAKASAVIPIHAVARMNPLMLMASPYQRRSAEGRGPAAR